MLTIETLVLGPVETNCYLVADEAANRAVVIDPAWDAPTIQEAVHRRGWQLAGLWVTHAHFDHCAAVAGLRRGFNPPPPLALHPADLRLWREQGGAPFFGLQIEPLPEPTLALQAGQSLALGSTQFEVRHAPGHTPGHVMFYVAAEKLLFCGDVIFQASIGRTDLPGGDYETLMDSIQTQVLTLADDVRLLSGHGPETTVGLERKYNQFLT
jgi:glyoxylase-like metal-dependent hydrolase (beta-lactamase superfamily II)